MHNNFTSLPGIYIHIPYCRHKCGYCDFYSVVNQSNRKAFVDALTTDFEQTSTVIPESTRFDTVYIGGGTPSLLSIDELQRLFRNLHAHFKITPDVEITIEVNPGTVSAEKLDAYQALGINRLSIGVQSFHDAELNFLERIHSSKEAIHCFELARKAAFSNISLDFIFALPGQSIEHWQKNIEMAVKLQPEHLSAYNLTYEPGTPFYQRWLKGSLKPQSEQDEVRFLETTLHLLQYHGYHPYEISNYARAPEYYSRHNQKYWYHTPYLGFGPSAHSFWNERRRGNVRSVSKYIQELRNKRWPIEFEETIDAETKVFEHIFLALRTKPGINLAHFEQQFGYAFTKHYKSAINTLISEGLAEYKSSHFRLTQKGLILSDAILPTFA